MRKEKGFTLIELLAVIVILAIISLIAVPIVLNIINGAKESSKRASVDMYAKAIEDSLIKGMTPEDIKIETGIYKTSESNPEKLENEKGEEAKYKITYTGNKVYCEYIEIGEKGTVYVSKCKVGKSNGEYVMLEDAYYSSGTNKEGNLKEVTTKEKYIVMKDAINSNVVDYKIYGNSKQETRSGKNLLNIDNLVNLTSDRYSIQIKNNSIILKGTEYASSTSKTLKQLSPSLKVGDTVTLSFDTTSSKKYIYLDKSKFLWNEGKSRTITEDDLNSILYIYNEDKLTESNEVVISNIQLEKGSSATSYEKYGKTPSIEIPSEIESVGDLITSSNCSAYGSNACNNVGKYVIPIKVSGKNLFDYNNITYGDYYKKENNGYFGYSLIRFGTYETLENYIGETVTISFDLETSETGEFWIYQYQSNGIGIKFPLLKKEMEANKSERISVTGKVSVLGTNDSYSKGEIIVLNPRWTGNMKVTNIQFELGEETTNYTPYKQKTTNIYLNEPLRKVGDAVDYIDLKNKKVVRNIINFTLDGSQNWLTNATVVEGYDTYHMSNGTYGLLGNTSILSNKLVGSSNWNSAKYDKKEQLSSATHSLTLRLAKTRGVEFSSTGIKTWLQENPIDVLHVLATPQYEDISLPDINLFEGYNNISINTKTTPSKFDISYKKK